MTPPPAHAFAPGAESPAAPASRLAADWVTIWQSELAGLASDREAAEHMGALLAAWFAGVAALRAHERAGRDEPIGAAGADAATGAAAAAAAFDAGNALAGVERRLSELERRFAAAGVVAPAEPDTALDKP